MHHGRNFLRKVIEANGGIILGKRYDYRSKLIGNNYIVYLRMYEGEPWQRIAKVPADKVSSDKKGDWFYYDDDNLELGVKHVI